METNGNDIIEQQISLDNEGRRSEGDRRNFSYTLHIPERRKSEDRRSGDDRRKFLRNRTMSQS
jgi:hypothetical protein